MSLAQWAVRQRRRRKDAAPSIRERRNGRATIVVPLDLCDASVGNEVVLVQVDATALAGVRPTDMQTDRDPVHSDDGFCDLTVHAFSEKSSKGRDHFGTATALVRIVVVAPSDVVGEESRKRVKVLVRKRRPNLLRDLIECHAPRVRRASDAVDTDLPFGAAFRVADRQMVWTRTVVS